MAVVFARISKYADKQDEAISFLRKTLAHGNFSVDSRISMLFDLGKLLDAVACYDDAFQYYRQGNDLKPVHYDGQATALQFDNLINTFTPERLSHFFRPANPSSSPIFILGMPRSGTSLTEQIVASHPKVFGAGELDTLRLIVEKLPETLHSTETYPFCLEDLDQQVMASIADTYLTHARGLMDQEQCSRFTDKMPRNFLHIGFIHLLFPQSPIIHCVRDPLDTCLSIYFHDFAGLREYSCQLESLGHYYRQYQRLMDFWKNTLNIPMLEVRYEEMVQGQESISRELLDYCRLPWDDRCLKFHKTKRIVNTASYQQVRQPMYTKSIGRWRNYEYHLKPLQQALSGSSG